MGIKTDFKNACINGDADKIKQLLEVDSKLLTEIYGRKIIESGNFELIKFIIEEYNYDIHAASFYGAIQTHNLELINYVFSKYIYKDEDSRKIRSTIYRAADYASMHEEYIQVVEHLLKLYFGNGNKIEDYFIESLKRDSSAALLKLYEKYISEDSIIVTHQQKEISFTINTEKIKSIFDECRDEEERVKSRPWDDCKESIALIYAINNPCITDDTVKELIDSGANYLTNGEAMKAAEEKGRIEILNYMKEKSGSFINAEKR